MKRRWFEAAQLCAGLAAVTVACSGTAKPTRSVESGVVSVTVHPQYVAVEPSKTQTFTASVAGAQDTSVRWTVAEGTSGGSVTDGGVYTAPATLGSYHIAATSNVDPTRKGTASVLVTPDANPLPLPSVGPCSDDAVPALSSGAANTYVKSPGPRMHFTAGQPLRLLADASDSNDWACPHPIASAVCPGTELMFLINDAPVGVLLPDSSEYNHWELRLPGGLTTPGDYRIDVRFTPYNPSTHGAGTPIMASNPTVITIDAPPVHARTITLTQDLVLSGSTPLDWTDATVVGNGYRVTSAAGYGGPITIRNAFVSGLGAYGGRGIDVTTTGAVTLEDTIFEATAPIHLAANGSGAVLVRGNEFRANNLVTYVASNPDATPVLRISGNTTGAKTFKGNRVGAGIVLLSGMRGWQIGGLAAGEGNVFNGPRAVLQLDSSSGATIQGNYLHHEYRGGWSQGFNLHFTGSSDTALAEHNVVHASSWPVQSFGGTFRYNLVVDSGHDWWRSAKPNTTIYRNVFVHTDGPDSGWGGGILLYLDETGIVLDGNTFDAGGQTSAFTGPAILVDNASAFANVRNNVFTGFSNNLRTDLGGKYLLSAGSSSARIGAADYNAWYNPLATSTPPYDPVLIGAPGAHDVAQPPAFAASRDIPYQVREGCVWNGSYPTRDVLARYRAMYRPGDGSPLLDAGDPASGSGTDIGAIDGNANDASDLFGKVLP